MQGTPIGPVQAARSKNDIPRPGQPETMTEPHSLLPPARSGYRMPAEWEPHAGTWITWPQNPETWPGNLAAIPPVYAQLVRVLAESEEVHILVNGPEVEATARRILREHRVDAVNVHFHHVRTNDAWARDYAPIFLRGGAESPYPLVAVNWEYNAWGGKYPPWDADNAVPRAVAEYVGCPLVDGGMVLEGGSIDVDGAGTLLTTEQCLLNPNRNPGLSREEIEQRLRDFLGVRKVLWLGEGIEGDDTDGHVDDLTRFVAPGVVVTAVEADRQDVNFAALDGNLRRLREMSDAEGRRLEVRELPMPAPVVHKGERLPASYANFHIANRAVVVPVFGDRKADERALGVLRECFPGREVTGLHAAELVQGFGAFHCITQQQPFV